MGLSGCFDDLFCDQRIHLQKVRFDLFKARTSSAGNDGRPGTPRGPEVPFEWIDGDQFA